MAENSDLTLITLNTWNGKGDYAPRLQLIVQGLQALEPGVVLLQGVFAAPCVGIDTGRTLAQALNMRFLHHPARAKTRMFGGKETPSTSGLSILSRLEISASLVLNLPSDGPSNEYMAQVATIRWDDRTFTVINTHLASEPAAETLRLSQARAIVAHVRRWGKGEPAVLAGDFNADPESLTIRWLCELSDFAVTDACLAAGVSLPTLADRGGSAIGERRVDYIFILEPPDDHRFRVILADRVLDQAYPVLGLLPSNHAGIRARLRRA